MTYLSLARAALEAREARFRESQGEDCEKRKEVLATPHVELPSGQPDHLRDDPNWVTLSAMRWGPAVGDDEPGIIIDSPNIANVMLAVGTLQSSPGDAFEPDDTIESTSPFNPIVAIEPGTEGELLAKIREAGFLRLTLDAPSTPAWIDDDQLSLSLAEIRNSIGHFAMTA